MMKTGISKQSVMIRVLYSMIPVLIAAIYYFGWRVLAVVSVAVLFAFLTEWVMVSRKNGKITTACFVTSGLYALALPPTVPFWIVAVGAIVAIFFGKEAFGGFGKNVFNPAIVGRAFVYICFPVEMTSRFVPSFNDFPGGFTKWSFTSNAGFAGYLAENGLEVVDVVSSATPLFIMKQYNFITEPVTLLLGNVNQLIDITGSKLLLVSGSSGEVCTLALIFSLVYLLYTKTIQFRLFMGTIVGAVISTSIFVFLNSAEDNHWILSILFTLLSGGLLYSAIFMVTEPISAPKNGIAQWMYSVFIGMMIVLFRSKSVFAGGVAFSILLGNMLAPSLDIWFSKRR